MNAFFRPAVLLLSFALSPMNARAQSAPDWTKIGGMDKANELIAVGRLAEAIPVAKAQLAEAEARLGLNHPDLIPHLQTLGTACFARQDYDEAEVALRRGLDIAQRSFEKTDPRIRSFAGVLFALYRIEKRPAEAAEMKQLTGSVQ